MRPPFFNTQARNLRHVQVTSNPVREAAPRRVHSAGVLGLIYAIDQPHERGALSSCLRVRVRGIAREQARLLERVEPPLDLRKVVFIHDGGRFGKRPRRHRIFQCPHDAFDHGIVRSRREFADPVERNL